MEIREATAEDLPAVMTVFDGAMLATDVATVRQAIDRGDLLVAVAEGRVLGACLLVGDEIEAVAVRRARRDQGIGTALVAAAADRRARLVVEFDPRVRPFWASLGFEIDAAEGSDRYRGVRE
ncbi:GNAT family N-acetyltransferase [Halorientalis pallida]|uniref:GNAT family N-acetyltransferase n=1 Tax=Halorientalis pallida TaxID=2479928 RepID=A0A498KWU7_9EURY|nr:GNAT family N-acetyltransferase [Halorientalis pallida]RXK46390.1 GNAT family N-acetyltransferase [Halorientalis pallida]